MSWKNGIRSRRWSTALLGAALAASVAALPSAAQEHFDVLLYDDGAGNLTAGGAEVGTAVAFPDVRVFEAEMFGDSSTIDPADGVGGELGGDFLAEEPGFFSYSDAQVSGGPPGFPAGADNLPGDAEVRLNWLVEPTLGRSLSFWDDGLGEWADVPSGETLLIDTDFTTDPGLTLGGTTEILDMVLATTGTGDPSTEGALDDHPDFTMVSGSTAGVYLAYGTAEVDGLNGPSAPYWLVFGTLDECEETESCDEDQEDFNLAIEEQIEAAILYTETNLVPEPGTALLLSLGLLGLGVTGSRGRRA